MTTGGSDPLNEGMRFGSDAMLSRTMPSHRIANPLTVVDMSYIMIGNDRDVVMAGTLGPFEFNVMLAVARLGRDAYGAEVRRELSAQTRHDCAVGAVYATLTRLEHKGLLESTMTEPTAVRGGRARRQYRLTAAGVTAIRRAEAARDRLWHGVTLRVRRT